MYARDTVSEPGMRELVDNNIHLACILVRWTRSLA